MTDTFTKDKRSWIMGRVHSEDTDPERRVRSLIHRLGYRFRLHRHDLPGSPDLVFPSRKAVLFMHGCFWHGHNCARGKRVPKANEAYWRKKIQRNRMRDRRVRTQLHELGWRVLVLWECRLKDQAGTRREIDRFLTAGVSAPQKA